MADGYWETPPNRARPGQTSYSTAAPAPDQQFRLRNTSYTPPPSPAPAPAPASSGSSGVANAAAAASPWLSSGALGGYATIASSLISGIMASQEQARKEREAALARKQAAEQAALQTQMGAVQSRTQGTQDALAQLANVFRGAYL